MNSTWKMVINMKYQIPVPKWKSILRSVLRHCVLLILVMLLVGTLIWWVCPYDPYAIWFALLERIH